MANIQNPIPGRETVRRKSHGQRRVVDRKPKRRNYAARGYRFLGWDGEGYTDLGGEHHYSLFGSSDGARVMGSDLTYKECFPLLLERPADSISVVFAGHYDITMMLKGIDPILVDRIFKAQPTYVDQYRVHYFRGKFLRIKDRETGKSATLYDVFSFFGCSFVKACEQYKVGSAQLLAEVAAMKDKRSTFDGTASEEVEQYMGKELDLLVMLMETLRARLAAIDIHPASWHGPGAVAATVLKKRRIKEARGTYDDSFRRLAESAYYGGRFEQYQRGYHKKPVYEYDIRSAYPTAMLQLPDLSEVAYYRISKARQANLRETDTTQSSQDGRRSPYGLYRLHGQPSNGAGYLPWRDKTGSIYYPETFVNGWYWGVEVPQEWQQFIVDGYEPEGDGLYARPFSFVQEDYDNRARLKAEGKPEQLAAKLALNSYYGKLAQSKGAKQTSTGWDYPGFHEVVWAGWITAYTRARMAQLLAKYRSSIIAIETDAVFSTEPLPLTLGPGLGQWEEVTADGIMYLQSGVYWLLRGESWSMKSRGFAPKGHSPELWLKHLKGLPDARDEGLAVTHSRFQGVPTQRGFGNWYSTDHRIILDGSVSKRTHSRKTCTYCTWHLSYADCLHPLSVPELTPGPTTPYPFPWVDPELAKALKEEWDSSLLLEDML